jgi:hypothetical protein
MEIIIKRIAAGLALSTFLLAGCSSSDSDSKHFCDTAKSKCPNDDLDPALCRAVVDDPTCGSVFMNFLVCGAAHQTCLPDGTTDESVITRECAKEQAAAEQCSPSDAGTRMGSPGSFERRSLNRRASE